MYKYCMKRTKEHNAKIGLARRRGKYFLCETCGEKFWRKPYDIAHGNCRFCSKQCYFHGQRGVSKNCSGRTWKTGDSNPNWKGGITPISKKIRQSLTMRQWREDVFKRDNWTCQKCGKRSKAGAYVRIEAHHVKPFAVFPNLRMCVDNGLTLCKKCHSLEPKGKEVYHVS